MQLLDPTSVALFVALVSVAALAAGVLAALVLPDELRITRRDRLQRHESIPTYYGRLHFWQG